MDFDYEENFEDSENFDSFNKKYGIKIRNYDAKSIYFNNELGQRDYKWSDAMLANSLFSDFLLKNGLKVDEEDNSTDDIISIDFITYTVPGKDELSYFENLIESKKETLKDKVEKLNEKIIKQKEKFTSGEIDEDELEKKLFDLNEKIKEETESYTEVINELIEHKNFIEEHKDEVPPKTSSELRTDFYKNGVDIYSDNLSKPVHYEMLYRSTGKAKNGSCMFIKKKLYKKALDFLRMGMKIPKKNCPIVELSAYSSLVASTNVGRIKIDPRKILVIEDVEMTTEKKVVTVRKKNEKECVAELMEKFEVKSTLFDGQALIDRPVFERAEFDNPDEKGNGYILLRNHFCKMAAFSSNIQEFFKDYCKEHGKDYDTFMLSDMFGKDRILAKDVEVITTNNAMKWTKKIFGVTYDQWCQKVNENDNVFGIVKTAHESKFGEVQRMSYQMVNALDMKIIPNITDATYRYIDSMKQNRNGILFDYLKNFKSFSNDYEVLLELVKINPDFEKSEYFKSRKDDIIYRLVRDARNGKLFQNADNLVIVGSPYAMLLAAAGVDVKSNPDCDVTFKAEEGTIQCWTERFDDGEFLAEFRSPFNGRNNLGYLHNVHHPFMTKYFNFGKQIIAVNLIGTDFQARNNGSDQDSDSIYTTNEHYIVQCAKKFYEQYSTIVNTIEDETKKYENTLENFAAVDSELANSKQATGESSNLAQLCLTYTYNFDDESLQNNLCSLSVIAQMAIDNAKRKYEINITGAIRSIKKEMKVSERGYPKFWPHVVPDFDEKKGDKKITNLKCPMNSIVLNPKKYKTFKMKLEDFFVQQFKSDTNTKRARAVERKIENYMNKMKNAIINKEKFNDDSDLFAVLNSDYDVLLNSIRKMNIQMNTDYISWLIDRSFFISEEQKRQRKNKNRQSKTCKNRALLLKVLYDLNSDAVCSCFSKNSEI